MMGKAYLNLHILNHGAKVVEIDALESKTISGLKILIEKQHGINYGDQMLYFKGNALNDSQSLSEIGLNKDECAQINMIVKPTPPYQGIPIKLMSEEVFKVLVKLEDTVQTIKANIHIILGVPVHKQILTLRDKELADQSTVKDLEISYKEKLELTTRHGEAINFKGITGTVTPIEVDFSDSIYKIKGRLEQIEGVPRETLSIVYKGKTLVDSQSLNDYQIKPDSTLYFYTSK